MDYAFPYLYSKTENGKWRYWRILLKVTPKSKVEGYLWSEYGE